MFKTFISKLHHTVIYYRNLLKYRRINKKIDIKISNTLDTVRKLTKGDYSIIRFGDGEFQLMNGYGIVFQTYNESLARRLRQILHGEDVTEKQLIGIPYELFSLKNYTLRSKMFWTEYWVNNYKDIVPFLNPQFHYYDSQVTRIYINRKNKSDFNKYLTEWKKVWNHKELLIVEGEKSRFGICNDLLSNAGKIERILCPAENAYDFYDQIKEQVLQNYHGQLILCVLGPTATILAYDLSKLGIHCLDIGNLDMEYEWYQMKADVQCAISGKYTFESKDGTKVRACNDKIYCEQIIKRIGC